MNLDLHSQHMPGVCAVPAWRALAMCVWLANSVSMASPRCIRGACLACSRCAPSSFPMRAWLVRGASLACPRCAPDSHMGFLS